MVPAPANAQTRYFGVLPWRWSRARVRLIRFRGLAAARLRLFWEVVADGARAVGETVRLRAEVWTVRRLRRRALLDLGEATYLEQDADIERARAQVRELNARIDAAQDRFERRRRESRLRVEESWNPEGPTQIDVPRVPEPEPVPSDPPGPVIVPEPGPSPHEPHGPVIVPEPGPPEPSEPD